jgi:hypothetical protein
MNISRLRTELLSPMLAYTRERPFDTEFVSRPCTRKRIKTETADERRACKLYQRWTLITAELMVVLFSTGTKRRDGKQVARWTWMKIPGKPYVESVSSLLFHCYFIVIPFLFHSYSIPNSFLFHSCFILISFLFHFYFIVISLLFHSYSILIPFLIHSYLILISFLSHASSMIFTFLFISLFIPLFIAFLFHYSVLISFLFHSYFVIPFLFHSYSIRLSFSSHAYLMLLL